MAIVNDHELMARLGKKGYQDFVIANKCKHEPAKHVLDRRKPKGRIKFHMCGCGEWTIENWEPTGRCKCDKPNDNAPKFIGGNFQPYYNDGLGAYIETRADEIKCAKQKGLICVG